MSSTDKSSTHQHTVRGQPTTNTGVHSHSLTAVDARIAALEAAMADVVLRITKLEGPTVPPGPGPVPPPIQPPVPPPIEPTPGTGTVRYIAPTGSDAADGLIGSPWRTIAKFFSVAKAGDTLYCRNGTYASTVTTAGYGGRPPLNGTASAPITVRAYPGETPLFTGGEVLVSLGGTCTYVTFDGLSFARAYEATGSMLTIGGRDCPDIASYPTHHITFHDCTFTQAAGTVGDSGHLIYFSGGSRYSTVEDCEFVGAVTGNAGNIVHTGLHFYGGDGGLHEPATTDYLVQRCTFRNWTDNPALILWDDGNHTGTGSVLNSSFIGNTATDIRADRHGAITLTGNSTTNPNNATWLYDPYDSAYTTASGNLFNQ